MYQAPNGENWDDVQNRANEFFKEKYLSNGTHLVFTHGVYMDTYISGIDV